MTVKTAQQESLLLHKAANTQYSSLEIKKNNIETLVKPIN